MGEEGLFVVGPAGDGGEEDGFEEEGGEVAGAELVFVVFFFLDCETLSFVVSVLQMLKTAVIQGLCFFSSLLLSFHLHSFSRATRGKKEGEEKHKRMGFLTY